MRTEEQSNTIKQEAVEKIRILLNHELTSRCEQNPRYSLRAFARDLGISAPRLSHILNGKQGLSKERALEIVQKINWNGSEKEYFCDLVECAFSRSQLQREYAEERLKKSQPKQSELNLDAFKIISDWYHLAILELALIKDFFAESSWIAKKLGISTHESKAALQRLIKIEALEWDERKCLKLAKHFAINSSGVPSEMVRKFHRQILEKAIQALSLQTTEERENTTCILALTNEEAIIAKKMIKEFHKKIIDNFSNDKPKDTVYAFSMQLFKLQN